MRSTEPSSKNTVFFCSDCGAESVKWSGRCHHCGAWNSLRKAPAPKAGGKGPPGFRAHRSAAGSSSDPAGPSEHQAKPLSAISRAAVPRVYSGLAEFDRVLGGGCVPGSLVLLSGDPGIGKSTLVLQMLRGLAYQGHDVLYVSGEESGQQILMRAERLQAVHDRIRLAGVTELNLVFEECERLRPRFLVIDSIQTLVCDDFPSSPGSPVQVRECSARLMSFCKERDLTCFIIGQVTKDGHVAGPKLLEHLVDTVLYLEGDNSSGYRILRAMKNRFGSTGEVGLFIMTAKGLEDVADPSAYFVGPSQTARLPGSAVSVAMEGTRSFLIEIQALVGAATYSNPRRVVAGMEPSRLAILIAVLEKHAGLVFGQNDVFASVAGGARITESAHDLATVAALYSSHRNVALPPATCFFGEVTLSGLVRPVAHTESRIREASKMGMKTIVLPEAGVGEVREGASAQRVNIISVRNVSDLLHSLASG